MGGQAMIASGLIISFNGVPVAAEFPTDELTPQNK